MHIFHKWSKWEQYTWEGRIAKTGILVPAEERGKWFDASEERQKRQCLICGKVQDERIGTN